MRFSPGLAIMVVGISFLTISVSVAGSPPANTIPVIGLKPKYENIDTQLFCMLSWHHFDGLSQQFFSGSDILENVVLCGDTTGMLTLVNPWELTEITQLVAYMNELEDTLDYALPVWDGRVVHGVEYTQDGIIEEYTPAQMAAEMEDAADSLYSWFSEDDTSVWFYYGSDEAPMKQWTHMVNDSTMYDNYIPNFFTQEMDSVYRPDLNLASDSVWQPTMAEVDPRGIMSWMAKYIRDVDSTREFSHVISCMHTITDWAGFDNRTAENDSTPPTPADQAAAVRAIFTMTYKASGGNAIPTPNNPSFIALDAYPFRLVGSVYQDSNPNYTQQLGDSLQLWMLDHYEECMDSTFIPACSIRIEEETDISVFFVPQSFGRAGGTGMWDGDSLAYGRYEYRVPTPQEFRMTCNTALIRGGKAILPYSLCSYVGNGSLQNKTDAGLLDENNIPFNAPFEEWAYMDRPQDSISYISPDSIPPFMDGYDPLYDLPDRPTVNNDQRDRENFLLWKFAAYGRLWVSARSTFAEIGRVAPELALLDWWLGHEDDAEIEYDGTEPSMFFEPQIKVFTNATESACYLFYLNRYCRANGNPYEITVDAGDFTGEGVPFSVYALDHNRRCLVEGTSPSRDVYVFKDTLDAGEARLLQMISSTSLSNLDIRITDPDVFVVLPTDGDTLSDYESPTGEAVNIHARFYNMSTDSVSDLLVYLEDLTDNESLDTQRVSFSGLDTDSCWKPDVAEAVFTWTPRSNDVGVHRLRVYTQNILGEPDTQDNDAMLVYVVEPADYATTELSDPWDMTEAAGAPPPSWYTEDIIAMSGWTSSAYSDSISGMFEGTITDPRNTNSFELNLGSGSSEYIGTRTYDQFSMIAKAGCDLTVNLHWEQENGGMRSMELGEIDSEWEVFGPYDLASISSRWDDEDAKRLWLEFSSDVQTTTASVRIGWIKLTE